MRKWRCDYRSFVNEHLWTIGKIYESDDGGYGMVCDNGKVIDSLSACEPLGSWCGFETTKFTEVFDEKEEVKMNKFKVGDVVKFKDSIKTGARYNGVVLSVDIYNLHKKESFKVKEIEVDDNTILSEMGIWIGFDAIELMSSVKTITITTSDTTTTITDGTRTTSINRYYTDKHNERNAVSIVIDKYYDELAEIERLSKLPKVGDKVKVVDHGKTHSTYDEWLIKNNVNLKSAIKWRSGLSPKNGGKYIIKEIHKHEYFDIDLALIEDADNAYIMNIKGLEVIK